MGQAAIVDAGNPAAGPASRPGMTALCELDATTQYSDAIPTANLIFGVCANTCVPKWVTECLEEMSPERGRVPLQG